MTVMKAYVVGRPSPIIREYRVNDHATAAELAAVDACSLDGDESEMMLVRVSGGLEFAVDMTEETLHAEPLDEPSGQPGPVLP